MMPLIITDANLSIAWARAFLELMKPGGGERHPSVITIQSVDLEKNVEHSPIRERLDEELRRHNKNTTKTVAGTIFPSSMWNSALPDDDTALFARYNKAWAGIKKCPANKKGVYFRRLTAFGEKAINQLDFISKTYKNGNHRKSALQASIFDPNRDHSNVPILGFPCLQQVTFTPLKNDRLSVTGFYAKQLHFEKAYGNYLGLYELGRFMAKQFGLKLTQVVCIASCLEYSELTKSNLRIFESDIRKIIEGKESENRKS